MKKGERRAVVEIKVRSSIMLPDEAAAFLRVSTHTLKAWRAEGKGPAYSQYEGPNGVVTYSVDDLEAYRNRFRQNSHEEDGGAAGAPTP